jgi:PPE-repeat protein
MSFLVLPPEMNSAAMHSGAGSGPMLEAAAAWDGLASELGSASSSFNAVTSGLVDQAWQGAAAQAMTAAAAPYTGWLSSAAQQMITTLEIDEAILSTPFNFGFPNIGFFNTGLFNVGDFNVGIGNYGLANVGIGNVGNNNIGEFLTGNGQIGIGTMSV